MAAENKPEYRFEFRIFDAITGTTVGRTDSFLSEHTSENGENENVEMEVGAVMRWFRNKGREFHEKQNYPTDNEQE